MAHYDCDNCGSSMGVGFGSCRDCTPAEYHHLCAEIEAAFTDAERQWNALIKEELEAISARRTAFIESTTRDVVRPLRERRHALEMKHHHSYRYRYERDQRARMNHPITGAEIHVPPGAQIPLFDN